MTAGLVSWQYYKDTTFDKNWRWCRRYFRKNYTSELLVQITTVVAAYGLSCMFWRGFWLFVLGFAGAWLLNILVEWFWAATHRFYNK